MVDHFSALEPTISEKPKSWAQELKYALEASKSPGDYFPLSEVELLAIKQNGLDFPMLLTREYARNINWHDSEDPLKKIIIPSEGENEDFGFWDTSGEKESEILRGLQHKYTPTAVLFLNQTCAGYCRYCFRRRLFSMESIQNEFISDLQSALEYIESHKEINNVLLTGGDPFISSTKRLSNLFLKLSTIQHVKTLRISTKAQTFLPSRFLTDKTLIELLEKFSRKFQIIIQCHFDHPAEINRQVVEAINLLQNSGCTLISQIVLIKGVNTNPGVLSNLFQRLHALGVTPQYLFHPRPVKYGSHFQLSISRGLEIVEELQEECMGPVKRFRYVLANDLGKIELLGKTHAEGKDFLAVKIHNVRMGLKMAEKVKLLPWSEARTWITQDEIL